MGVSIKGWTHFCKNQIRDRPCCQSCSGIFVCVISDPAETVSVTALRLSGSSFCQMEKVWIRDWRCAFYPLSSSLPLGVSCRRNPSLNFNALGAQRGTNSLRSCLLFSRWFRLRRNTYQMWSVCFVTSVLVDWLWSLIYKFKLNILCLIFAQSWDLSWTLSA